MFSISSPEALVKEFNTRDPFVIAECLEITTHRFCHPESDLPGLTCLVANRPSFFINTAYFAKMQKRHRDYTDDQVEDDIRQVGGHELGHCCRHRSQLREAPIKEYEIFNVRSPLEADANEFTAGLLIDTEEMLDLLHSDLTILQVASAIHVNVNLLIYKIELLRKQGYSFNEMPYIPKNNFIGHIHGAGSSEWC